MRNSLTYEVLQDDQYFFIPENFWCYLRSKVQIKENVNKNVKNRDRLRFRV
jgi:hypothetical protein